MSDEVVSGGNSAPAESSGSAPMTFEAAFAADASPASDPGSNSQDATAAAQPESANADRPTTGDDRSPFIPRSRFDEVNKSLHELKQWKESRPWADLDPQVFDVMRQTFVRMNTDTRGFAVQLLGELVNHPEHSQAIRSELARLLGTRQTPAADDTMPDPDVEIVDAHGRVTGRTYSDQQLQKRDAFLRAQMLKEVDAKYAPHLQTLEQVKQERELYAQHAQAQEFGRTFASELAKQPLFEQHKAEIGQVLRGMRLQSDHPSEVRAAAYQAYLQVVGPKLLNGQQQSVVADLQRKAHASTAVNPAAAALSTPKAPKSFHDLPADAWA